MNGQIAANKFWSFFRNSLFFYVYFLPLFLAFFLWFFKTNLNRKNNNRKSPFALDLRVDIKKNLKKEDDRISNRNSLDFSNDPRVLAAFQAWKTEKVTKLNNSLSLSDLLIIKEIRDIYYADLLGCFEWKIKRQQILWRDGHKCQKCQHYGEQNHVHHNYYLKDKLPWDIDDTALITLCYHCHKAFHENNFVSVYKLDSMGRKSLYSQKRFHCNRCDGSGYLPQFDHVMNGICFACDGGYLEQGAFEYILNSVYSKLNDYDDNSKRIYYRNYFYQLRYDATKIRFENSIIHPTAEPDDLPF